MSTGKYFKEKLNENLQRSNGPLMFEYQKIYYKVNTIRIYPIYISIDQYKFTCNLNARNTGHIKLFTFFFNDLGGLRSEVSSEAVKISKEQIKNTFINEEYYLNEDIEDITFSSIKRNTLLDSKQLLSIDKSNNRMQWVSIKLILIDFLFDVYHSELISEKIEELWVRNLVDRNFIFKAIYYKYDYYYKNGVFIHNKKDSTTASDKNENPFKFSFNAVEDAESKWLEIIHSSEALALFSINQDWFDSLTNESKEVEKNISLRDYSIKSILKYYKGQSLPDSESQIEKHTQNRSDYYFNVTEQISNWYLKRFDYFRSVTALFKNQERYKILILLFFFLILLTLPFLGALKWGVWPLVLASIILFAISFYFRRFYSTIELFLPKLFITILITWIALGKSSSLWDEVLPQNQIQWDIFISSSNICFPATNNQRL